MESSTANLLHLLHLGHPSILLTIHLLPNPCLHFLQANRPHHLINLGYLPRQFHLHRSHHLILLQQALHLDPVHPNLAHINLIQAPSKSLHLISN
jgi:hypothetical protein